MTKLLASLLTVAVLGIGPANANRQPAQSSSAGMSQHEEAFTGCVQRSPNNKNDFVMSGKNFCVRLTGKFSGAKLSGHEATVRGTMTAATSTQPAEIRVTSVTSVGGACADSCSLLPPGGRGVKKRGELPGREGGTPGMSSSPAPIP